MGMIGTYWTIEYICPNSSIDETHVLKVVSERDGILATEGLFLSLNRTFSKNTLESTIKHNGRLATVEEIAAHESAFRLKPLETFRMRYEMADDLEEPLRTKRMSDIMTDMERTFEIPMLNNDLFNAAYPEVMDLYKLISNARAL